jgi:hypothetical protein
VCTVTVIPNGILQQRLARYQFPHPRLEPAARHRAHGEPETAQQGAHLVLDIAALPGQLLAGQQQRTGQPVRRALGRHPTVPAGARQLRQPLRVVRVGLVHPARQRRPGPARIDDHRRHAQTLKLPLQPARLAAGLQHRHARRRRQPRDRQCQKLRLRRLAPARNDRAVHVDDADVRLFQGYVQSDILFHGHAPSWPIGAAPIQTPHHRLGA